MDRINNIVYPIGTVCTINADEEFLGEALKFLQNRPLVVISTQMQMFDTLIVIPCGSRDRPGIEISLKNHQTNSWIGGYKYTLCCPYNCYTIRVDWISNVIGYLDPFTLQAVQSAFAYHLGLNPTPPPYMAELHEELYAPRYNVATLQNTQLSNPHCMISSQYGGEAVKSAAKHCASDKGTRYRATEQPRGIVSAKITKPKPEKKTPTTKRAPKVWDVPDTPNLPEATKAKSSSTKSTKVVKPTIRAAKSKPPKDPNTSPLAGIVSSMDDICKTMLVFQMWDLLSSRLKSLGETPRTPQMYGQYRRELLRQYKVDTTFQEHMEHRIQGRVSNIQFLTDTEMALLICFVDPKELHINVKDLKARYKVFLQKYHVRAITPQKYKTLPNYEFIKTIV